MQRWMLIRLGRLKVGGFVSTDSTFDRALLFDKDNSFILKGDTPPKTNIAPEK